MYLTGVAPQRRELPSVQQYPILYVCCCFVVVFFPSHLFSSHLFFSLPPSRSSDPGSHSSALLPLSHCGSCPAFLYREDFSSFFPRRMHIIFSLPSVYRTMYTLCRAWHRSSEPAHFVGKKKKKRKMVRYGAPQVGSEAGAPEKLGSTLVRREPQKKIPARWYCCLAPE